MSSIRSTKILSARSWFIPFPVVMLRLISKIIRSKISQKRKLQWALCEVIDQKWLAYLQGRRQKDQFTWATALRFNDPNLNAIAHSLHYPIFSTQYVSQDKLSFVKFLQHRCAPVNNKSNHKLSASTSTPNLSTISYQKLKPGALSPLPLTKTHKTQSQNSVHTAMKP